MWIAEVANHGASGVLNEAELGGDSESSLKTHIATNHGGLELVVSVKLSFSPIKFKYSYQLLE